LHGSTSSLVHRRGPVCWFRKAVPVDLTDRLGSSDIRRSLRTCSARMARQRAWALILVVEDAFAVLRDAELSPGAREASNAIFSHVMDDLDRSGQQWSQRLRYNALMDSLGGGPPASSAEAVTFTPVAELIAVRSSYMPELLSKPMEMPSAATVPSHGRSRRPGHSRWCATGARTQCRWPAQDRRIHRGNTHGPERRRTDCRLAQHAQSARQNLQCTIRGNNAETMSGSTRR
jgi:hypothetical protein